MTAAFQLDRVAAFRRSDREKHDHRQPSRQVGKDDHRESPYRIDSRGKNNHERDRNDRDKSVGDLRRQPLLRKSSLSVWPRAPRKIPLDELDHGAGAARFESMKL